MLTFVTTTSYGTWLPGDVRGWVSDGKTMPADPVVEQNARNLMRCPAVIFSSQDRQRLFQAITAAAEEFSYNLRDVTVESWHLHWIIEHSDQIETMVRRLKNRMRQSLNRGRIWTEGYCANGLFTDDGLHWARQYIAQHSGCRLSAGRIIMSAPGSAGGGPQ